LQNKHFKHPENPINIDFISKTDIPTELYLYQKYIKYSLPLRHTSITINMSSLPQYTKYNNV